MQLEFPASIKIFGKMTITSIAVASLIRCHSLVSKNRYHLGKLVLLNIFSPITLKKQP